ncbi:MAG: class I SAM-dependent methyltransferase [Oscillospiraceae bacterium]|nr:class I SAM-dependent methyltransferase [Oscillospiraceae bacterium]
MFAADGWRDYEALDTGNGAKLERWGDIILSRPDPQVIWPAADPGAWSRADAVYTRAETGGGAWTFRRELPERWETRYGKLRFHVRPTGFKHTGLFPEQAVNWDWMTQMIREANRPLRALNLFAYTGGATLACAAAGARVTHVDAAKGMVQWAKENYALTGLPPDGVRWIVDDAARFAAREARRGHTYDAIALDPPSYGRGPDGEVWKLETSLYPLVETLSSLLSDKPLFFLLNSYTTGLQPVAMANVLSRALRRMPGAVDAREVCLPVRSGGMLPCGASARWTPSI